MRYAGWVPKRTAVARPDGTRGFHIIAEAPAGREGTLGLLASRALVEGENPHLASTSTSKGRFCLGMSMQPYGQAIRLPQVG